MMPGLDDGAIALSCSTRSMRSRCTGAFAFPLVAAGSKSSGCTSSTGESSDPQSSFRDARVSEALLLLAGLPRTRALSRIRACARAAGRCDVSGGVNHALRLSSSSATALPFPLTDPRATADLVPALIVEGPAPADPLALVVRRVLAGGVARLPMPPLKPTSGRCDGPLARVDADVSIHLLGSGL